MDPINIIAGVNLIATFGANASGAKKGFKGTVTVPKEKPDSFLQKTPVILSTTILILFIIGIFKLGTLSYDQKYQSLRYAGLIVYIVFSWMQVWAFKSLGDNYSQEVLILRHHKLVTKGPFRIIRHPQYLSQILMDLSAGVVTLSYLVTPLVLIEIPLLVMRASLEEKLLEKNFKDDFLNYKAKSGYMLPFIG